MYKIINITDEYGNELVKFENNIAISIEESFKDFFYGYIDMVLSYEIEDKLEIFKIKKIDVINKIKDNNKELIVDKTTLSFKNDKSNNNERYIYRLDSDLKDLNTKKICVNAISDSLNQDKLGIYVIDDLKKIYLYSNKGRKLNGKRRDYFKDVIKGKKIYPCINDKRFEIIYKFDMKNSYKKIIKNMKLPSNYKNFLINIRKDKKFKNKVLDNLNNYFNASNLILLTDSTYDYWYYVKLVDNIKRDYTLNYVRELGELNPYKVFRNYIDFFNTEIIYNEFDS